MISQEKHASASYINGFLYGVSVFSGKLREYENSVFCMEPQDKNLSVGELINMEYSGQYKFSFAITEVLQGGVRELDKRVGCFLLQDPQCVKKGSAPNLQKYLSFRLMDMIDDFFEEDLSRLKVTYLRDELSTTLGDSSFFCVSSDSYLLVLQFNKNR